MPYRALVESLIFRPPFLPLSNVGVLAAGWSHLLLREELELRLST